MKPRTSYNFLFFLGQWYCFNGRTVFFNCALKEIRKFWNIFKISELVNSKCFTPDVRIYLPFCERKLWTNSYTNITDLAVNPSLIWIFIFYIIGVRQITPAFFFWGMIVVESPYLIKGKEWYYLMLVYDFFM